jgi:hypothetical protein
MMDLPVRQTVRLSRVRRHLNTVVQFTPQETKLVERLRAQDRRWPRMKWVCLVVGIFAVCVSIYILVAMLVSIFGGQRTADLTVYEVLFLAVEWPKFILEFGFGIWFIIFAIRDWHGNVHRMLLLRLLDAQEKETKPDEKPVA